MQKPEVRIIDHQQESTNTDVNISQSEIDNLLYKYGFSNTQPQPPINNQSFEDMVNQGNRQEIRKPNIPSPITFDSRNVNYSETKWTDIELDSNNTLGVKIQIVTDMKIN